MIRQHIVLLIQRFAVGAIVATDNIFLQIISASREELEAALPDQSPDWYDQVVQKNMDQIAWELNKSAPTMH